MSPHDVNKISFWARRGVGEVPAGGMQSSSDVLMSGGCPAVVSEGHSPQVWVLTGYRAGESSQVLALAEALGWPFEVKQLVYRKGGFLPGLLRRTGIESLDPARSNPLQPPWPNLVLSAGMRNEPVARWIRQQAGGATKLVHVGRTWAGLDHFDLIVTTPQYRVPRRHNVQHNSTTLSRVTERRLSDSAARWSSRLEHLPRPYTAVIVGGDSGPFTLGPKAAARLGAQANAMARESGGSLLVTTSARTGPAAVKALASALDCPNHFFRWSPDESDNPYYAYLGLADAIIVTGDSIAMLSEACATRKPVYIFDLGSGAFAMRSPDEVDRSQRGWRLLGENDFRLSSLLYRLMMAVGPRRASRDIRLAHRRLIEAGRAVWLGDQFPANRPQPLRDSAITVSRIRRLFGLDEASGSAGPQPAE